MGPATGCPVVHSKACSDRARRRKETGEGRRRSFKGPARTLSSLRFPPGTRHPQHCPVLRQRACARSSSPPPFGGPPFHPGNRGATRARARAGCGPGGAGRRRCGLWLKRRWPRTAAAAGSGLGLSDLLRHPTPCFDVVSGPADLAPGHGLPESKRGGGRGPAEAGSRVGGAPRPGWMVGARAWWGPAGLRPRRVRPPGLSSRRERRGARRPVGTAPGDPGWPVRCTWSWARAPEGNREVFPFVNRVVQLSRPPLILAASQMLLRVYLFPAEEETKAHGVSLLTPS